MGKLHIMDNRDYSLGLYEKAMPSKLSWKDKLRLAKRLNFDFLEISIDETDDRLSRLWDMKFQDDLKSLMKSENLSIRSMCLSAQRKYPFGSKDPEIRKMSLKIFKAAVDMASNLGIRTIQVAGYDVYYESSDDTTRLYFEKQLQEAIRYAAQFSVMCAFETMETDFMNTVEKAMVYVEYVDSPYCGVYPDIGNIKNAKLVQKDVIADIRMGSGHLVATHLKETVPGIFREIPFGTGHVDFESSISELYKLGVRTYVCECWDVGKPDYEEVLQFNNTFLRQFLDAQMMEVVR